MGFQKGNKLGGRPKGIISGQAFAKEWMEKEGGWDLLKGIASGTVREFKKSTQVRAAVAMYLADRAYGKAPQLLKDSDGKDVNMADFLSGAITKAAEDVAVKSAITDIVAGQAINPIQNGTSTGH